MKKRNVFYFILITALIQLVCQVMYRSLADNAEVSFLFQYLINLPASILIAVVDFLIINTIYKKLKWRDNGVRILIDLVLTSLFMLLFVVIANSLLSTIDIYNYIEKQALPLIVWNTIIVLLIEIFFYNQKQLEVEKKLATAEKEKIQYQYETLKAQINPHFLFNSLNVLSSLAYQDAEKANLFTKKLSGVYRYLLLTNSYPTVTLKEELNFLESYLFLEKIRFENTFSIDIIIDDNSLLNKYVIPVSLQLLVENALKHNITTKEERLDIRIHIFGRGITVSNNLQLRSSVDKGGVGLMNLQKQYALYNKDIHVSQIDAKFMITIPYI